MENNKCTQCGAAINTQTMTCDYCGTTYSNIKADSKNITADQTVIRLSDMSIIKVLKGLNPKVAYLLPVVIFMTFWCTICFGMGIFAISEAGFMGAVPFFMFIIGIVVLVTTIIQARKGGLKEVIEMCKSGDWSNALALSEKKENKSSNYKLAYLLIKVHHFDDYSDAQLKLSLIPVTDIAKTLTVTPVFAELAKLYGINVSAPDVAASVIINRRGGWGGGFGGFGGLGGFGGGGWGTGFGSGGRFR